MNCARRETGVNVFGLPTGFVGLAIADLLQHWITWTPEAAALRIKSDELLDAGQPPESPLEAPALGAAPTPFQTIRYFDGDYVTVEAEDFATAAAPSWRPAEWGIDPGYYCGAGELACHSCHALCNG